MSSGRVSFCIRQIGCRFSKSRAASACSRPTVWRWQRRYAEEGLDGLLRDKTRPPGKPPLPAATIAKVLALTCSEPPGETTHWTGRAVAQAVGISLRAVQRIWQRHRLQPHRIRTFKRSNDETPMHCRDESSGEIVPTQFP